MLYGDYAESEGLQQASLQAWAGAEAEARVGRAREQREGGGEGDGWRRGGWVEAKGVGAMVGCMWLRTSLSCMIPTKVSPKSMTVRQTSCAVSGLGLGSGSGSGSGSGLGLE